MKKSLKGAITAGAVGIILAGGLASPASAAAGIDSNFYVTGPARDSATRLPSNSTRQDLGSTHGMRS